MEKRGRIAEIVLTAACAAAAVLCVALLLRDTVFSAPHTEYLREVSESRAEGIFLVNVNTDDVWSLQELPGIGETLAQRIVDYREKNGAFTCAEDLLDVEGIGEKKLAQFRDAITF